MKLPSLSTVATRALALTSIRSEGSAAPQNQTSTNKSLNTTVTRNQLQALRVRNTQVNPDNIVIYPEGCIGRLGKTDNEKARIVIESGTNGFCAGVIDKVMEDCSGYKILSASREESVRSDSYTKDRSQSYYNGGETGSSDLFAYVADVGSPAGNNTEPCIDQKFQRTVREFVRKETRRDPPSQAKVEEKQRNEEKQRAEQRTHDATIGSTSALGGAMVGAALAIGVSLLKNRRNSAVGQDANNRTVPADSRLLPQ